MGREQDIEQLRIMTSDAKGRKILDLVLGIAQADIDALGDKMVRSNDWKQLRAYQGGIRALEKLTNLNGSIERALKPATPEE